MKVLSVHGRCVCSTSLIALNIANSLIVQTVGCRWRAGSHSFPKSRVENI